MTDDMTKALVLLAFGLAMMVLNIKAHQGLLILASFLAMLASFCGSGYFVIRVVLA